MNAKQAMNFLVDQTRQQAALEGVPFSEEELRLLRFTEDVSPSDEAQQFDTELGDTIDPETFESKASTLLDHGYARAKKENPETFRQWREAIQELRKGDHYFLDLWSNAPEIRPRFDRSKLFGTALLVVVAGMALIFCIDRFSNRYGIRWGGEHDGGTHSAMPLWLQRSLIGLMVWVYVYFAVLPWIFKSPPPGIAWLVAKVSRFGRKEEPQR